MDFKGGGVIGGGRGRRADVDRGNQIPRTQFLAAAAAAAS